LEFIVQAHSLKQKLIGLKFFGHDFKILVLPLPTAFVVMPRVPSSIASV